MELVEMYGLLSVPFGIALVGLFLSQWLIARLDINRKVLTAWIVGIVLSVAMLAAGKWFGFGAYAAFEFNNWKDWAVFALVALSPGMISNGLFDSGLLEKLLNLIKK